MFTIVLLQCCMSTWTLLTYNIRSSILASLDKHMDALDRYCCCGSHRDVGVYEALFRSKQCSFLNLEIGVLKILEFDGDGGRPALHWRRNIFTTSTVVVVVVFPVIVVVVRDVLVIAVLDVVVFAVAVVVVVGVGVHVTVVLVLVLVVVVVVVIAAVVVVHVTVVVSRKGLYGRDATE